MLVPVVWYRSTIYYLMIKSVTRTVHTSLITKIWGGGGKGQNDRDFVSLPKMSMLCWKFLNYRLASSDNCMLFTRCCRRPLGRPWWKEADTGPNLKAIKEGFDNAGEISFSGSR